MISGQLLKLNTLLQNLDTDSASVKNTKNGSSQTFSRVFNRITTAMKGRLKPAASGSKNATGHRGSKKLGHTELLRKLLMGTGVSLEKMNISREGIPALKKFLIGCGFSKSDVHGLINDLLNSGQKTKKINMSELFSKLSDLKTMIERKKKDPVLEASAIPYLEVGLRRLGVNASQLEKILSEEMTENGDLNLESFLQSLKRIMKSASPTPQGVSSDELAKDIKEVFSQLGMEGEKEKVNGMISLDRFVQLIEEAVSKMTKSRLPDQDVEKTMKSLIGEVVVDSEEGNSRLRLQSRALQKLIDELIGPKDSEKQQAGIGNRKNTRTRNAHIVSDPTGGKDIAQRGKLNIIGAGGGAEKAGLDAIRTGAEKIVELPENRLNTRDDTATQSGNKTVNIAHADSGNRPATEFMKIMQHTRPSPSSLPLYMVNQVSRRISRSVMQGEDNIRLRLKPPHLGTVKLEMGMKGNVLKLNIAAENQVTRELLLSHVQELKQSLIEQGIKLERMDVHINQQFGESMKDAHQRANGEGRHARGRSGASTVSGGDEEIGAVISRGRMDAVLDLIA